MMEVAPGIVQFVGSITAEKDSDIGPLLCDEENPCKLGDCDEGVCYQNDDQVLATLYRISWGVSAPSDETFTPFIDENGIAVKFNLVLKKGNEELYYYQINGYGSENTLELLNGDSDGDVIVTYSPEEYKEACIIFGAAPEDYTGEVVENMCSVFKDITLGKVPVVTDEEGRSYGSGSTSERESTTSADVGRAQI